MAGPVTPGSWGMRSGRIPLVLLLRPRHDQAGLVGGDHGLGPIPQPELVKHPADVRLHRLLGDHQAVSASDWLLPITPAAAFAVQQAVPQYPQVTALLAIVRLLPAGAVGRFGRTVRLRRARPGPGCCPALPERRLSQTLHAGPPGLSVVRRVEAASMRDTLHAEWTKLRTVSGPAWLLAGGLVLRLRDA